MRIVGTKALLLLSLGAGVWTGAIFGHWFQPTGGSAADAADFRLIGQAWAVIHRHYVDEKAVQPTALTYGAIEGMVNSLGDTGHSVFLTPRMVKQLAMTETGHFKGVGLELQMKDRQVVVVAAFDHSPAQRAGLRAGDVILSVDGRSIAGLMLPQVVERVTGRIGTTVELTILDPKDHHLRTVALVRSDIRIESVTWSEVPGTRIADLRLASFDRGAARELRQALEAARRRGATSLILDLRNNPGGVLEEAVKVASQFLTHGNVVLIRDGKGDVEPMPVEPGGLAPDLPMAVLIDGGSASAAEIVAGALRDAGRAELIGEKTFGTGTVLRTFPLSDGSALLLAVQEWLTPKGQSFWHKGITPELVIPLPVQLHPLVPAEVANLSAAGLQGSGDWQFLAAIRWLAQGGRGTLPHRSVG